MRDTIYDFRSRPGMSFSFFLFKEVHLVVAHATGKSICTNLYHSLNPSLRTVIVFPHFSFFPAAPGMELRR
jgi:hypothetical protein